MYGAALILAGLEILLYRRAVVIYSTGYCSFIGPKYMTTMQHKPMTVFNPDTDTNKKK